MLASFLSAVYKLLLFFLPLARPTTSTQGRMIMYSKCMRGGYRKQGTYRAAVTALMWDT
jgi:hypothetical protein